MSPLQPVCSWSLAEAGSDTVEGAAGPLRQSSEGQGGSDVESQVYQLQDLGNDTRKGTWWGPSSLVTAQSAAFASKEMFRDRLYL